jgi:hypothetical protein
MTRPIGIKAKIIETKNESHHWELGIEKTGNEKWSLGAENVSPGLNLKLEMLVANRNMDVIPIPEIRIFIRRWAGLCNGRYFTIVIRRVLNKPMNDPQTVMPRCFLI